MAEVTGDLARLLGDRGEGGMCRAVMIGRGGRGDCDSGDSLILSLLREADSDSDDDDDDDDDEDQS